MSMILNRAFGQKIEYMLSYFERYSRGEREGTPDMRHKRFRCDTTVGRLRQRQTYCLSCRLWHITGFWAERKTAPDISQMWSDFDTKISQIQSETNMFLLERTLTYNNPGFWPGRRDGTKHRTVDVRVWCRDLTDPGRDKHQVFDYHFDI